MNIPLLVGLVGGALVVRWLRRNGYTAQLEEAVLSEVTDMPGTQSTTADTLNGWFRDRMDALFQQLELLGFAPYLIGTWRDQERQDYYLSKGWTTVSWSFHMATTPDGAPDALAADVGHDGDEARKAAFYLAMMEHAPDYGLQTGGTYSQTSEPWASYGLGWDPGHLEPAKSVLTLSEAKNGERP